MSTGLLMHVLAAWTWAMTQKGLVANIFTGFAICFPAAFLTLLVATRNPFVSLIATLTIAFIVASVLGLCKAYLDWSAACKLLQLSTVATATATIAG